MDRLGQYLERHFGELEPIFTDPEVAQVGLTPRQARTGSRWRGAKG
jgi:hypothetical protein